MLMGAGWSWAGGDQGLLNAYFKDWATGSPAMRLPFTYNMTANASYGYAPAFERFRDDIHVVHFIGAHKPWHGIPTPGPGLHSLLSLVDTWWRMHDDLVECCSYSGNYMQATVCDA